MKKIFIILVCFSCSQQLTVKTDFDRGVEIQRLTTWSWLDNKNIELRNDPLFYNELNDKRVKVAVGKQLTDKGYVFKENASELIVHYHIAIENKTALQTEPYGYSYNEYWRGRAEVFRYREGTLIIDFMDSRNCELIWRGSATSILDDDRYISEKAIDDAVAAIFREFPTSAAKEVLSQ